MKLPIPNDWDGETWCRYAVCWPYSEQWLGVFRGFVTLAQRGRTWDERTGLIKDVQEIGRAITVGTLPEKEVYMACGDEGLSEIALAIQALATATASVKNAGCCEDKAIDPSGGYQGTAPSEGGDIPIYGTEPPYTPAEGETFPPEFENQAEFDQHKCSVAHAIFDGVMLTLSFLSGISIANITALAGIIGAGIAGIIIFPPSALVVMVGAVLAIGGFLAMFLDIRNLMLERKTEFICAMYDTTSVSAAIGTIADLLDIIILLIPAGGLVGSALKTAVLLLMNSNTLNQLYTTTIDIAYPDADCSECCPPCRVEDIHEVDLSEGWEIDGTWVDECGIIDNQGEFTVTQGDTLDLGINYPGLLKFLTVTKDVDPFLLNQPLMHFEFEVLSVSASVYFGVIFDDDTCELHGPGTALQGLHTVEEAFEQENLCKTVVKLVFCTGLNEQENPCSVSISQASLICEAEE